jgi:hypothetical protein
VRLFIEDCADYERLLDVANSWERNVYNPVFTYVSSAEDVTSFLSLDSTGQSVTVRHEVDGLRTIEFL